MAHGPVAFVLKGYPRLSETFIAQEIRALERRGLDVRIVSLRHPTDRVRHPIHSEIEAPVMYLPEYLGDEPGRVFRALGGVLAQTGFFTAFRTWFADLLRDPTPNRVRRFGQAAVLAAELDPAVRHLHTHFIHTPASVSRYAALMTGRSWSFSAHAKDVWTTPAWEIREKARDAAWGVTCTEAARQRLAAAAARSRNKIERVYHGLDFTRIPAAPERRDFPDGSDLDRPVLVASVGRCVAKKGYATLLDALALLPEDLNWRFVHIGGGPLRDRLRAQAIRLGLDSRVTWRGAEDHSAVFELLQKTDLFVLAARINRNGDRDGLPNVLMEAQSQAVAVIATPVAGIPELIRDGETGLLAEADMPAELAAAMERLMRDTELRRRLGAAGAARVRSQFDMIAGIDRLAARFGLPEPADGQAANPVTTNGPRAPAATGG